MNHDVLKNVIFDQHEIIRNAKIVPRRYGFDPNARYVLTGLRRAGKSTLLYGIVQNLIAQGTSWEQIIYINFEDERLADFSSRDFNDILLVHSELSDQRGFYFFDELQNIEGWEKFARRLADADEQVCITGSNAGMLSAEIATTLGGRYLTKEIAPYRLDEYLLAVGQPFDENALHTTHQLGRLLARFEEYLHYGGFPEAIRYQSRREYVESVYQKVLLGDIVARKKVRNVQALRVLMKKVAETVCSEVSFSTLHGMLKAIGIDAGKSTVIDYLFYAEEAYLLFSLRNAVSRFADRESNPRYYFGDNGLLGLFLHDKDTALLENLVACALYQVYGDGLYYLRSSTTGIDIDFVVPDEGLAIQVAYSIAGEARRREVENLIKLAKRQETGQLVIVTKEEQQTITVDGVTIEVLPAYRFLLELAEINRPTS